jgi:hypothetical protein
MLTSRGSALLQAFLAATTRARTLQAVLLAKEEGTPKAASVCFAHDACQKQAYESHCTAVDWRCAKCQMCPPSNSGDRKGSFHFETDDVKCLFLLQEAMCSLWTD